jgi:Novel STAND NTPase 1/Bacterial Ig domain/FHA domain
LDIKVRPFIGPRPFEEINSSFFYGRDREVQQILALILSSGVSLVYAKSGIGKTSIFNAKIIPELRGIKYNFKVLPIVRFNTLDIINRQRHQINENYNIYVFNTIQHLIEKSYPKLEDKDRIKKEFEKGTLLKFFKEHASSTSQEIRDKYYRKIKILIYDQFEEFFNIYINNRFEQQKDFFNQIKEAITNDPDLRIVFIIREEYVANLDTFSSLLPDGFRRKFRLEPLRKESAIYAVEEPLLQALLLEPGLKDIINEKDVKTIANKVVQNLLKIHIQRYDQRTSTIKEKDGKTIDNIFQTLAKILRIQVLRDNGNMEIIKGEFIEPVQLQVVCLKLWENSIITGKIHSEIDSIEFGNVDKALTDFYTDAVNTAKDNTKAKEGTIRKWCEEKLITSAGTRGIVYQDVKSTAGISNKVVDVLQDKYLIHAEARGQDKWFELTHDRMIKPIRDSNKTYEEKQMRKKIKIIKTVVPIVVVLSIIAILQLLPYFEKLNAEDKQIETMINHNITIPLKNNQTDIGNKHTYFINSVPKSGSLFYISNDTIIYEPNRRYVGNDSFSYVVSNGKKNSSIGIIDIRVNSIPLRVINQTVESMIDKPVILSLIDWDYPTYTKIRDVGKLPIKLLTDPYYRHGPYHGYLASEINSNKVIYAPYKGFTGKDYFEFCLPKPENTTLCSINNGSVGHVNITVSSSPRYFGYLIIDNGIMQGTIYPIYSTTNTIGRATEKDSPDIPITDQIDSDLDQTVSRLHGKISYSPLNNTFSLQDTESTNKIISQGKMLHDREIITLRGGDSFLMGNTKIRLLTDLTNVSQYR